MECRQIFHHLLLGVVLAGGGGGQSLRAAVTPEEVGYSVGHWTVEDGLPMQSVTALAQTSDGFLWCGTFDGLARFDGAEFKIYYPHEVPALEGFQITALRSDDHDRLWIVDADGKLAVLEQGQFRRLGEADGLAGVHVAEVAEGADGSIWIRGANGGQFLYLRGHQFQSFGSNLPLDSRVDAFRVDANQSIRAIRTHDKSLVKITRQGATPYSFSSNEPVRLGGFFELVDGSPAVTAAGGIYIFDGKEWQVRGPFPANAKTPIPPIACEDRVGNYWLGGISGMGLEWLRPGQRRQRIALPNAGTDDKVHALLHGREGNVWVGSTAGLFRLRPNAITRWTAGDGSSLREAVRSLAHDTSHRLWLAQDNAVRWLDSATNGYHSIPFDGVHLTAWRVAPARNEGVWLGVGRRDGDDCEIWHVTPQQSVTVGKVPAASVEDIHESTRSNLWVGTSVGLFLRTNGAFMKVKLPTEAENRPVNALVEDRLGRLHASVLGVGLFRLEPTGWWPLTQSTDQGSDRIQALCFDAQDTLWVASDRPGLARWKDGHWFAYDGLEGELPRKHRTLIADQQDGLWLASRWGLVRIDRRQLNQRADQHATEVYSTWFDRDDGLTSINCANARTGMSRDTEGRLWLATDQGISVIDPAAWSRQRASAVPTPVRIEQVLVADTPIIPNSRLRGPSPTPVYVVPASRQPVEIRFTGINLTAPDKLRFRYRLEGFDKDWVKLIGARFVHFSRLSPGRYLFRLKSINNEGIYNHEGATLALIVQPEWWQRGVTRAVGTALLLTMVWAGGYLWVRRQRRERALQAEFSRQLIRSQEQERKRIAGDLHDSLGQNLLVAKNLALLGVNANPTNSPTARQFGEISDAVAMALNETRRLSRALRPPELDRVGLTKAVGGMVQRTCEAAGLECFLQMDEIDGILPPADEISIYRLVQEAMNNIVKHARGSRAEVEIVRHPDHLALQVTDDGCGFEPARFRGLEGEPRGAGLAGMEERVRLAGGEFSVTSEPGCGTTLRIRLPIKSNPA